MDELFLGEEVTEIAEPSGENEQETADPVEPVEDEKPIQTKEERAKFAAERRKAEMALAEDKARKEERARVNEVIKRLGIPNPLDEDKRIESFEDLEAYEKNLSLRKIQNGEGTAEDFERLIANSEPVKKLASALEPKIDEDTHRRMQSDIDKITAFDPSIKTVDDLPKMDRFEEFSKYVKAGNNFIDAYKLAYFDKITGQAVAKQKALNDSKSHLKATVTRGQGALTVPSDEMALFKVLNPEMSESEIQKYYNKYKK